MGPLRRHHSVEHCNNTRAEKDLVITKASKNIVPQSGCFRSWPVGLVVQPLYIAKLCHGDGTKQ